MSPVADIPLKSEEIAVLHRAWRQAHKMGAGAKREKAVILAGIVESRGRHDPSVSNKDLDSVGFLQQRPSMGWGPEGESIEKDTAQFIRASGKGKRKGSAGQLAQSVQRSAYPDKYDQQSAVADALIRRFQGRTSDAAQGHRTGDRRNRRGTVGGRAAAATEGAPTLEDALELLRRDDVLGFAQTLKGVRDGEAAAKAAAQPQAPARPRRESGGNGGDGTRQAHELHELIWRGPGSQTVKRGKKVPRDTFTGHDGHVHAAAGPNQIKAIGNLARRMGLTVSENPGFGDDVDPVHVEGSHHNRRGKAKDGKTYGGAVDVSGGTDEKLAEFAARVADIYDLAA